LAAQVFVDPSIRMTPTRESEKIRGSGRLVVALNGYRDHDAALVRRHTGSLTTGVMRAAPQSGGHRFIAAGF
jgi:hypothetical protein